MKTKLLVGISLGIAWIFLIWIFLFGFLFYQPNNTNIISKVSNIRTINSTNSAITSTENTNTNNSTSSVSSGLTLADVSKHNNQNDCYVILNGRVYDLTNFLSGHSGGSGAIVPYCGKDGTSAFNTKDQNPASSHRSGDVNILNQYYVGVLQ